MLTIEQNALISKALFERLAKEFPTPRIKPGADMDKAMYYAGAQAVLEMIKQLVEREDIDPHVPT